MTQQNTNSTFHIQTNQHKNGVTTDANSVEFLSGTPSDLSSNAKRIWVDQTTTTLKYTVDGVNIIGTATNADLANKVDQSAFNAVSAQVTTNTTNIATNTANISSNTSAISANAIAITNIGSASPKGAYPTLAALQAAFPTGTTGIYLVTADGHWYYWNGSAWTDGGVYQSTSFPDRSVTPIKTTFFGDYLNIINPSTINAEQNLFSSNGTLVSATNWATSDYIPVTPTTAYHVNNDLTGSQYYGCYAFYNTAKTFISYVAEGLLSSVTSPAGAAFMRVAIFQKTGGVYRLLLANLCLNSVPLPPDGTKYAYNTIYFDNNYIDKDTVPTLNSTKLITSGAVYNYIPTYTDILNLMNPNTITTGFALNGSNGQLISSANFATSDFIPVSPSTSYHIQNFNATTPFFGRFCFYTSGQGFISSTPESGLTTVTTPANAGYLRYYIAGQSDGTWNLQRTTLCKTTVKLPFFQSSSVYPYGATYIADAEIDTKGQLGWKFKYMTSYGDSLVGQGKWQTQVVNYYGMYHTNCGQGGSRVSGNPYIGSDGELKIPMWDDTRINAIPTYSDTIMIHGGTNDHDPIKFGVTAIGDLTSTDPVTTFYGAYKTMLNKLIARCPNARILLLLPFWNSGENTDSVLENIRDAIRVVGNYYGFPVFESRKNLGFNAINCSTYFLNEGGTFVHVNTVGGNRVADTIIGFIKGLAPFYNQTIALSTYSTTLNVAQTVAVTTNGIPVTWTTSDATKATVNSAGLITAVATGAAIVTATDSLGNTATVAVTVS